MTILPCHLCHLPAVVHTVAGEGTWDAEINTYRASYVEPVVPEACPMQATGEGVCNSGACKSPTEAVSKWNGIQEKGAVAETPIF